MAKLMENKVGIVTGAGSGIGQASALAFAREGARVVVSDLVEKAGQETVRQIKEAGGEATFIKCDVSQENEVKQLIEQTVATYGQLDWAHNNVGINPGTKPITELATDEWKKVIDVNLNSMYYCLKYEILAMLESGGGAIVNTSAGVGLIGEPGLSAYVSSKWAINGLTKTVALEYAKQGIRVNSICPGMTETPLLKQWAKEVPEQYEAIVNTIPMARLSLPQDQANAAVWLCSDQAAYVTGVNFPVDGGVTSK